MAYRSKDLSALAYAKGFTLWHYRTADRAAEVDSAGYFNGASRMLRVGDLIMLDAGVDGVPDHGVLVVVGNSDATVAVRALGGPPILPPSSAHLGARPDRAAPAITLNGSAS